MKTRPYCFLLIAFISCSLSAQTAAWLNDDQARQLASRTITQDTAGTRDVCFSLTRREPLEDLLLSTRRDKITSEGKLNSSIYAYLVSPGCTTVAISNGRPTIQETISVHGYPYAIVLVDRTDSSVYQFYWPAEDGRTFARLARSIKLDPDKASLIASVYRDLVWAADEADELTSLRSLRRVAEDNFASAYSPYGIDERWESRFRIWWSTFRRKMPKLDLSTTEERTADGTLIRGYAFKGFNLTTPRSDPPPKGTPTLEQWILLVRSDGTVQELPRKVIYRAR